MEDKKTKSTIAELGGILTKGDYVYRFIKMADGEEGEHWSKERKTLEAQDELFKNKTEVEYSWQRGAEGKGAKLRVYAPKEDAKPDSGKRKSAYAVEAGAKDDYWKNKTTFEEARVTRNDKKIEMQHYQNLVAPFYLQAYQTGELKLKDALAGVETTATAFYNKHNPDHPAADVSK